MSSASPIESRPLSRLSLPSTLEEKAAWKRFSPRVSHTPDLPKVNYAAVTAKAPQPMTSASASLPPAAAVVICWTDAEWAALQHVFCSGDSAMTYASRTRGSWAGWQKYAEGATAVVDWNFWGEFTRVQIGDSPVLLFKSNTHLDHPGAKYLQSLIERLVKAVKPKLILSTGTAGGTRPTDHVGTVNVVDSAALYQGKEPPSKWPTYKSSWKANWKLAQKNGFDGLLFAVPTVEADLKSIVTQFNAFYKTGYPLATLNVNAVNVADPMPKINNLTGTGTPLLTTDSFVVGTNSGNLGDFACVEMDDAIIYQVCAAHHIQFGSVRNISDPVQNADLPATVQGDWGQAIYDAYGFYTSYNGAIAAWAVLDAQFST